MYSLALLLLLPLISSSPISNETTTVDELDPLAVSSNATSSSLSDEPDLSLIAANSTLAAVLEKVEAWQPWINEKEHEVEEIITQWKDEQPSIVIYVSIGMVVGLALLVLLLCVRCCLSRRRFRCSKIRDESGDTGARKNLMSEDLEEM